MFNQKAKTLSKVMALYWPQGWKKITSNLGDQYVTLEASVLAFINLLMSMFYHSLIS
jgi:hypothetical protein